jgi:tRNA G18 (ribose-2'-O)-methylase SpoU
MRKLSHEEILDRQKKQSSELRLPFHVVLNDIRSLYNVGSIFRTSDAVGVGKIWICGITGHPPSSMISKTALGAEDKVPWEYRSNIEELLKELQQNGFRIVLLEQIDKSIAYDEFIPTSPTCLIVGNEIEGVSNQILQYCDCAVEIEMVGLKNSLNVAVAFGVMAYQIRHHLKKVIKHD